MGGGHTGASARATERARLKDRTVSIFQARALDPRSRDVLSVFDRDIFSNELGSANYALARSLASVATQSLARSLARLSLRSAVPVSTNLEANNQEYSEAHEKLSPSPLQSTPANKLPQYAAAIIATMGGFAMGTVLGWSAPAVEKIKEIVPLTKNDISWIGSIANLGGALVMLPMAFILDRLGRRVTMLGLAPPLFGGWLLIALFSKVPIYIAGRFITGLFGAAYSVAGPVYNGEIAQKEIRGTLGVFYQLFLCAGILFSYIVGYVADLTTLSCVCSAIPVLFFVAFYFMPETPLYLLMKNKREEAKKSLQWLRGKHYNIESELNNLEDFVRETKMKNVKLKDVLKSRAAIRGLIISAGVMMCQQLSGIKAVVFYAVTIFKDAGSTLDPYICTIIVGAVLTGATGLSAFVVDRFGRRRLLLMSHVCTTICLASLGYYFYVKEHYPDQATGIGWLPLSSMCIYLITYTMGSGACSWVILGEIFPNEIKGMAGSFSAFVNWFLAFVVTVSFPYMVNDLGSAWAFWIFSMFSFLGLLFVWFCVIETKGKTLEEIQKELSKTK
uniref:Major facilitator superfamily (MFS) profile domain-containing protein n=1 Tax=Timema shepardi TaxID=629360 RepID=A0A7R9B101_TIMSH|nr:unnamed protein product [Timema shepardi]